MSCTIYPRAHPAAAPVVRTLLVNPHTAARQALGLVLEQETAAHIVAQVRSCGDAQTELNDLDLAIVDQQLPDGICLDLVPALQAGSPTAHVLVWTPDSAPSVLSRACEAAALPMVSKSAGVHTLLSTVQALTT